MENLPKISAKLEKIAKGFDQPTEHLQSEGEILIKNLVQKQLSKKIDLNEQLSNKKEFVSPQDLVQITDYRCGQTTLENFKETTAHLNLIENLRFYGLSPDEINLYLDSQKGHDHLKTKYKNLSKDFLDHRLQEINEKISSKKSCNTENLTKNNVSRHVKELASSIKPDSEETKLYQFAISNLETKRDDLPAAHPINSLKDLESQLFGHLNRDEIPNLQKRRKVMKKLDKVQEIGLTYPVPNLKSKWDVKDSNLNLDGMNNIGNVSKDTNVSCNNLAVSKNYTSCGRSTKSQNTDEKVYTCQRPNYYTIKDGKIVKLQNNSKETIEKTESVEFKRLTDDEIRLNPKFSNYERGIPSKVLYIKNIAKNGKDEFLNIFENLSCDNEKPEIKLMTGKMQGQAFITFKDENRATDALNKYNGYFIKEKPIIISYGKNSK